METGFCNGVRQEERFRKAESGRSRKGQILGWEIQILDAIQTIRTPVLDRLMKAVTALGNAGICWILFAVVLLLTKQTRKAGLLVSAALILDLLICNGILKPLVNRIRPYEVNTAIELLIAKPSDASFPSGHTAASFAVAGALGFGGFRKLMIWTLPIAAAIAFSRMYLYVHFPTDILSGILTGLFCGYAASKTVRKYYGSGLWSNMRNKKKMENKTGT